MLKYVNVTLGEPKRTCLMPRFARSGRSWPFSSTRFVSSPPSAMKSRSPCVNARISGCDSSMMLISMRPICGSVLPRMLRDQFLLRCVGVFREADRAVIRVGLEHHARRAPPFLEAVRSCAHRLAHHVGAGGFDRFARDGHRRQSGEPLEQRVIGLRQAHHDGVAVRRLQPFDAGVVVEFRAGLRAASTTGRAPTMRSVSAASPPWRRFGSSERLIE